MRALRRCNDSSHAPGSGPTPRISTSASQKWLQFLLSRSYVQPCHSSCRPSMERRNYEGAGREYTCCVESSRGSRTCGVLMDVTPSGMLSRNV